MRYVTAVRSQQAARFPMLTAWSTINPSVGRQFLARSRPPTCISLMAAADISISARRASRLRVARTRRAR